MRINILYREIFYSVTIDNGSHQRSVWRSFYRFEKIPRLGDWIKEILNDLPEDQSKYVVKNLFHKKIF
jgi:uncharacterized membrane protein